MQNDNLKYEVSMEALSHYDDIAFQILMAIMLIMKRYSGFNSLLARQLRDCGLKIKERQ
jgi:hypothetical protein